MKYVLIALAVLIPAQAQAISRYNSTSLSCNEVRQTVRTEGAVILRWKSQRDPSIQRYSRFVVNDEFCPAGERAADSSVPAADTPSCSVLECKQYSPDDNDIFLFRRRF